MPEAAGPQSDQRLRSRLLARVALGLLLTLLLGALTGGAVVQVLARQPALSATWRVDAQGHTTLLATTQPALMPWVGRRLAPLGYGGVDLPVTASSRWTAWPAAREHLVTSHRALTQALAAPVLHLRDAQGQSLELRPLPRGVAALGSLFWLYGGLALSLLLMGAGVLLARPDVRNLLFLIMAVCQSVNLLGAAIESALPAGLPNPWVHLDTPVRLLADLFTAAAIVHACCLHPRRIAQATPIAAGAWAATVPGTALVAAGAQASMWWAVQLSSLLLSLGALALLSWPYRREPHPFASALRRAGGLILVAWALLSVLAIGSGATGAASVAVSVGSRLWYVLMAALLLLAPALSRSQRTLREFGLLTLLYTAATASALVFITLLGLPSGTALGLSLLLSCLLYVGARQWLHNRVLRRNALTTERMFEQLYRIAREVEQQPAELPERIRQLLSALFDAREARWLHDTQVSARAAGRGATLIVPLQDDSAQATPAGAGTAVMLRYAQRGQRLFTDEDALLASRIVDQLRRAVGFDRAVELGRIEERNRLAQDLHDDIGARLLTMIYKADSPEAADYARHTLQDLKTLTRGLGTRDHPLSHACAEWKADLTQRLACAHVVLDCHFEWDDDLQLNVVQWSGLTRVLRELVSNVMAHAQATQVTLSLTLAQQHLSLSVCDDGQGSDPSAWAHGLGLGGVRKRVRQLGGSVAWSLRPEGGVCCVADFPTFAARR